MVLFMQHGTSEAEELCVHTLWFFWTGTGSDWQTCPSGTYSSATGLYDASQCLPCDAGKYCIGEHLTATSGDCDAGKFYRQDKI